MDKKPYANNSTLSMPANQTRVLKNQVSMLGRAIGNIFLPIVAKVLPYLNQLVYALRELAEWIVQLLGFEDFDWGNATGADNSAISDMLDDTEGVSDNLDKAADNAKKFKAQLQGFDKLNNLTSNKDDDNGDGGAGVGGIDSGLLDKALDDALTKYQKKWDEAFKNMNQSFSTFADNVKKAFEKGGAFGVGSYFAESIINSLNSIKWNDYKELAKKFGENFGAFVAGLLAPDEDGNTLFGAIGTAIAESINVAIAGFTGWITTFEEEDGWENLGKNVAQFVGNLIDTIKWDEGISLAGRIAKGVANAINSFLSDDSEPVKKIGEAAAKLVKMGVEAWFNFTTTFKFSNLGKKIADGINEFFKEMNKPVYDDRGFKTGMNGWQKLGYSISGTITGIADTLITALDGVNWIDVGQAIGDLIGSIEWGKIDWKLGTLAEKLVSAIGNAISGLVSKDPLSASIVGLVAAAKLTGLDTKITASIENKLKNVNKIKLGALVVTFTSFSVLFDEMSKSDSNIKKEIIAGITANIGILTALGPEALAVSLPVTISLILDDMVFEEKYQKNYEKDIENGFFKKKYEGDGWLADWANKRMYVYFNTVVDVAFKIDKAITQMKMFGETIKQAILEPLSGGIIDKILGGSISKAIKTSKENYNKLNDQLQLTKAKENAWKHRNDEPKYDDRGFKLNVQFDATETKNFENTYKKATDKKAKAKTTVDATTTKNYQKTLSELYTKDYSAVLTGTGKDSGVKKISDLLKTPNKTSTLTGTGKDSGVKKISDLLKTDSKTSTLSLKAKKNTDDKTSKNLFSDITNGFKSTIHFSADWQKGVLNNIKGEAEKALMKADNSSFYYSGNTSTKKTTTTTKKKKKKKKADGGFLPRGQYTWKGLPNIKRYASGGDPTRGTLFWAGEAGAEIVGNTTRGTEVLNQSQIAQAMAESMESANAQQNAIMRQQNQLLREEISVLHAILEKTGITSKDVFNAVRTENNNYTRVNGHGAFA